MVTLSLWVDGRVNFSYVSELISSLENKWRDNSSGLIMHFRSTTCLCMILAAIFPNSCLRRGCEWYCQTNRNGGVPLEWTENTTISCTAQDVSFGCHSIWGPPENIHMNSKALMHGYKYTATSASVFTWRTCIQFRWRATRYCLCAMRIAQYAIVSRAG